MTKPSNKPNDGVRVLSVDDARQIIASYAVPVSEATMILATAILRQHRVMLVQVPLYEYGQIQAGTKRLTLEVK